MPVNYDKNPEGHCSRAHFPINTKPSLLILHPFAASATTSRRRSISSSSNRLALAAIPVRHSTSTTNLQKNQQEQQQQASPGRPVAQQWASQHQQSHRFRNSNVLQKSSQEPRDSRPRPPRTRPGPSRPTRNSEWHWLVAPTILAPPPVPIVSSPSSSHLMSQNEPRPRGPPSTTPRQLWSGRRRRRPPPPHHHHHHQQYATVSGSSAYEAVATNPAGGPDRPRRGAFHAIDTPSPTPPTPLPARFRMAGRAVPQPRAAAGDGEPASTETRWRTSDERVRRDAVPSRPTATDPQRRAARRDVAEERGLGPRGHAQGPTGLPVEGQQPAREARPGPERRQERQRPATVDAQSARRRRRRRRTADRQQRRRAAGAVEPTGQSAATGFERHHEAAGLVHEGAARRLEAGRQQRQPVDHVRAMRQVPLRVVQGAAAAALALALRQRLPLLGRDGSSTTPAACAASRACSTTAPTAASGPGPGSDSLDESSELAGNCADEPCSLRRPQVRRQVELPRRPGPLSALPSCATGRCAAASPSARPATPSTRPRAAAAIPRSLSPLQTNARHLSSSLAAAPISTVMSAADTARDPTEKRLLEPSLPDL
ncbi:unnamed protein product [Trichogramma brassicae]|uniref:Uncharacterized protein n=1 Tax=Trichogramma brassicae TaxID=86971 RepID=A0A6H5IDM7_9HYME|nr:unnamed protein product [Trichogramma brassicae]